MLSLTILPSHRDAKLGPAHTIAGRPSSSSAAQEERPRMKLANSFSIPSKDTAADQDQPSGSYGSYMASNSGNDTANKIHIRLAPNSVLLPFLDRSSEVKDLLHGGNSRSEELLQMLRTLFEYSPSEWNEVQTLLFETDRNSLDDRDWLTQLYSHIFPRSPLIWCRLADCIGAHGIDWSNMGGGGGGMENLTLEEGAETGSIQYADVFSEAGSSVMTERNFSRPVSAVEFEALHVLPDTFQRSPVKVDRLARPQFHQRAKSEWGTSAAGSGSKHTRTSSIISTGEDQEVDSFLASHSKGFAGLRLSLPYHQGDATEGVQSPGGNRHVRFRDGPATLPSRRPTLGELGEQNRFQRHRRLSSLFKPQFPEDAKDDEASERPRSHSSPVPSKRPASRSPRGNLARSYVALDLPVITKTDAPILEKEVNPPSPGKEHLIGLLPDGRTRHPSAGEGSDGKAAAALLAFKQELKLSGYGEQDEQHGIGSHSSLTTADSAFSPLPSEVSCGTTVPSLPSSPETRKTPLGTHWDTNPLASWSSSSPPARPSQQLQSHLRKSSGSAGVIFPIAHPRQHPRSQHLSQLIDAEENKSIVTEIIDAIGVDKYEWIRRLIRDKERDEVSDEALLETIGKKAFVLVDQEKESEDTVERYLLQEDYRKRWNAFAKLCNVWQVDDAVIREAKRRSGPAVHLC